MTMKAIYNGEELTVHFSADAVRSDYGVSGSPVWYEPENIKVDSMDFLGHDLRVSDVPGWLMDVIYDLADEVEFERI